MLHKWIDWLRVERHSPRTIDAYLREIQRLNQFTHRDPLTLDTFDLAAYLASKRVAQRSDSTLYRTTNALKSFYKFAQDSDSIAAHLPLKRPAKRVQRTLSQAEANHLLYSFDTSSIIGRRNLALCAFMLDTGFRAAEVCSLRTNQIDLGAMLCWNIVKGGQEEYGVFSPDTANCLSRWFTDRAPRARCEAVFVALDTGGQLTPDGLRCIFHRIGRDTGIKGLAPHVMRRSYATLTSLYGAPARAAQEGGRWKKIEEYQQYTRAITLDAVRPYLPTSGIMRGGGSQPRNNRLDP